MAKRKSAAPPDPYAASASALGVPANAVLLAGCRMHPTYRGLKPPQVKCQGCENVYRNAVREKLAEELARLTPGEGAQILQSLRGRPTKLHDHEFSGRHIKFGYYADPHVGHSQFSEPLWQIMLKRFKAEGVDRAYCPGDNVEGMSGRPGHIYELSHIGAHAQLAYASDLFGLADRLQFCIIDGNHDQWFKEKGNAGTVAGEELATRNKNVRFLGEWEADVRLASSVVMRLYHANDGTAYADSYKLQKLIESFTGGLKPNIVLSGHYHKQIAVFRRNVFGFECGTLCGQSQFMRGRKLPAHMGFGIIEIWVAKRGGIERLRHEFFPWYD